MIGTAFFALGLCLFLMRSCTPAPSTYSPGKSDTTITVDGHPATPQERQQIEAAMKASQTHPPAAPSSAHPPK